MPTKGTTMDAQTVDGPPMLLLTPEQAAHAPGLGRSSVYELMRGRQIRSVKIGRSRRIPYASLLDFIEGLNRSAEGRDEWPA
jgi:excisionase family DNA binding protein